MFVCVQVHEFSSSEDEAENTEDEESGEESDTELFSSVTHNTLSTLTTALNVSGDMACEWTLLACTCTCTCMYMYMGFVLSIAELLTLGLQRIPKLGRFPSYREHIMDHYDL